MDCNAAFADFAAGLPEDLERMYRAGDFEAAHHAIGRYLAREALPPVGRGALAALQEMMRRLPENYTLTRAEAIAGLRAEIPDFTDGEFDALVDAGRIDWRYLDGTPRYLNRFVEALRLYPDMNARGLRPESQGPSLRDRVIAAMEAGEGLGARITLRASVTPSPALLEANPGARLCAWLPVPAACELQSGIEILDATPGARLAPEDAPQRTLYWDGRAADAPFTVTYRYRIRAPYRRMDQLRPAAEQPRFDLEEQPPHILFTPWLRSLCAGITGGCHDPLEKARAIYDYVTRNTRYRYQPAYVCLESIADTCAKTGWGDCGVMALLFITLCRIAGIPARWQSGLYVTPDSAGAHDWAQFYIAPYGWLWADCSFGSGAFRVGNEKRRLHYFGNLDPLRMVANRSFYAQLTPPDEGWRNDPYDNQTGEATLDGRGVTGEALVRSQEVVDFAFDAAL